MQGGPVSRNVELGVCTNESARERLTWRQLLPDGKRVVVGQLDGVEVQRCRVPAAESDGESRTTQTVRCQLTKAGCNDLGAKLSLSLLTAHCSRCHWRGDRRSSGSSSSRPRRGPPTRRPPPVDLALAPAARLFDLFGRQFLILHGAHALHGTCGGHSATCTHASTASTSAAFTRRSWVDGVQSEQQQQHRR